MPRIDFELDETLARRFRGYVSFGAEDECWEWQALRQSQGYGQIGVRQEGSKWQHVAAHRVSWALYRGPIPAGLHVLHACDNPGCVNPNHLFLGTHQDNMRDKCAKGRHRSEAARAAWARSRGRKLPPEAYERAAAKRRGAKHFRAQAVEIDGHRYPTQTEAAKALGLTRQAVHYMVKRGAARLV